MKGGVLQAYDNGTLGLGSLILLIIEILRDCIYIPRP